MTEIASSKVFNRHVWLIVGEGKIPKPTQTLCRMFVIFKPIQYMA